MEDEQTRRKFYRTDFHVKGEFEKDGTVYEVKVENISLKGVLIKFQEETSLNVEDKGEFTIFLPNSVIKITIPTAELVHNDDKNTFGLVFNEIDADSMIHLRRLLELNSVFEGEIEKELTHLKDQ